jgi:hypothetical protein
MFTVLSNIRNSNLYLIAAVAVTLIAILTIAIAPSVISSQPALIPGTGGSNANDLFRQEELALYDRPTASSIGGPAFFEYRRGEWSIGVVDAMSAFRQEELSLYNRSTASSLGSPAFYEYRQGEWSVGPVDAIGEFRQEELLLYNRSADSSIGGAAFYEYRRGEWTGQ